MVPQAQSKYECMGSLFKNGHQSFSPVSPLEPHDGASHQYPSDDIKQPKKTFTTEMISALNPVPTGLSMINDSKMSPARLWNTIILDTWWPETMALSFSAGCLVLVAVILRYYDGRPNPTLPTGITLNAVVAILSTASRSSLLFAITATVGQSKWCWFRSRPRTLHDLQRLDEASRGPLGSFGMLLHRTVFSTTTIGALVIILALGLEPSFQQILAFRDVAIVDQRSPASAQIAISEASPYSFFLSDDAVHEAMNAGIWSSPSQFDLEWSCPSGNCTWTPFSTLGICSMCENTTTTVKVNSINDDGACRLSNVPTAPNDPVLNGSCTVSPPLGAHYTIDVNASYSSAQNETDLFTSGEIIWAAWSLIDSANYPEDTARTYLNVSDPDLVLNHVQLRPVYSPDGSVTIEVLNATQCILSICAKEFTLDVRDGEANVKHTANDFGSHQSVSDALSVDTVSPEVCWNSTRPGEDGVCGASNMIWPTELDSALSWDSSRSFYMESGFEDSEFFELGHDDDDPEFLLAIKRKGFSTIIDAITASLSKSIIDRSNSKFADQYTTDLGVQSVAPGETWVTSTVVRVRWEWLALPISLLVISIIFLIWTVLLTHRYQVPLWKSSLLATLYNGMEDILIQQNRSEEYRGYQHVSDMKDSAAVQLVQLEAPKGTERVMIRPWIRGKRDSFMGEK